ncbi:MAG: hypothetical protein J7521_20820 [Caulobacter sp.]|nr:hypothetical protein [Caulobacter sp.]
MVKHFVTLDPKTGEYVRRYRDGQAFVAIGQPHPLGFWRIHPAVATTADEVLETGEYEIDVWLTPEPLVWTPRVEQNKVDGPPDFTFRGGGRMGPEFWERHPAVQHFEIINWAGGDSMDDDFWNVRVWLKGSD